MVWTEIVAARRTIGGVLLALTLVVLGFFWAFNLNTLYDIGLLSMIVLILIVVALLAIDGTCEDGEIRRAITLSIMILFFALIAVGKDLSVTSGTVLDKVLTNFWVVLSSVIAFFGGRALENLKP